MLRWGLLRERGGCFGGDSSANGKSYLRLFGLNEARLLVAQSSWYIGSHKLTASARRLRERGGCFGGKQAQGLHFGISERGDASAGSRHGACTSASANEDRIAHGGDVAK